MAMNHNSHVKPKPKNCPHVKSGKPQSPQQQQQQEPDDGGSDGCGDGGCGSGDGTTT